MLMGVGLTRLGGAVWIFCLPVTLGVYRLGALERVDNSKAKSTTPKLLGVAPTR